MKLKEIKPGMVIYCKTENEANRLLWELVYLGYRWWDGKSICELHFEDSVNGCGYWIKNDKKVDWARIGYYRERTAQYGEITPFSSLIIEEKTYEDGLNEAWECAKKIALESFSYKDALTDEELKKAFGTFDLEKIMTNNVLDVIAKLEAYEAEKQIKVGCIVKGLSSESFGVVTKSDKERAYVLWNDGSCGKHSQKDLTKTGKHIYISSVLAEIGKE